MIIEKTLLTVEELAERWGVGRKAIRGMIDRGEVKVVRVGRLIKISRSHVEFIENGNEKRSA